MPGPALKWQGSGMRPWALAQMLTGVLLSCPRHVHLPWASKQRAPRDCWPQATGRAQVGGPRGRGQVHPSWDGAHARGGLPAPALCCSVPTHWVPPPEQQGQPEVMVCNPLCQSHHGDRWGPGPGPQCRAQPPAQPLGDLAVRPGTCPQAARLGRRPRRTDGVRRMPAGFQRSLPPEGPS